VTLVTRISANWGTAESQILPSDLAANPSARRHGIRIEFECEDCGHASQLTLAQHKGETLVAWERAFGEPVRGHSAFLAELDEVVEVKSRPAASS
jgi:hypothetical protein